MIYYPIQKMKEMGLTEVLLVSGKGHAGHFLELLSSGQGFGLKLAYEVQEEAGGIAQALSLAENFVGNEKCAVILGDNIFFDDLRGAKQAFEQGDSKAHLFLKQVPRPQSYGVPRIENERIVDIFEKPIIPPSSYAVTGCYFYAPDVFDRIRLLKPSERGELEITDVNRSYAQEGTLSFDYLKDFWGDCGESIDGMMEVARTIQDRLQAI